MLHRLRHYARLAISKVREHQKSHKRSARWDETRDAFLQDHPLCVACGGLNQLQVHHVLPFILRPDLELDPKNLIVLCMGLKDCHLTIGHGSAFSYYNPNVIRDARQAFHRPHERLGVEHNARKDRLPAAHHQESPPPPQAHP